MSASTLKTLRVLSDPTRLRILCLLDSNELSVADLQEILGMGQSRISTHLSQLRVAELISSRRSGRKTFYLRTRNTSAAIALDQIIKVAAKDLPEISDDFLALKLLLKRRRDTARIYFNQLAGKFSRSYCPGRSWEAIAEMLVNLLPPLRIADLGAGEGTLSLLLARSAEKVIAVDNSEKMVEYGRRLSEELELKNLEYRLGDMEDPPIDPGTIDLAIFSHALHHALNPAETVARAAALLAPKGRLIILDLAAHQVEETRERFSDRWLGFSSLEIHKMLESAGLANIEVRTVYREQEKPHFETLLGIGSRTN